VIGGLVGTNPEMKPDRFPRRQVAVHSATHKYIRYDDRPGEFYDLVSDPFETNNLVSRNKRSPALAELRQVLEEWRSDLAVFPPRLVDAPGEIDAIVIDRLRDLGYVE
jgi:hypothetical protein